jgi:hypothetical protein
MFLRPVLRASDKSQIILLKTLKTPTRKPLI